MAAVPTKTVRLAFEVPEDFDVPSEILQKMKDILLASLAGARDTLKSKDQEVADALLVDVE